MAHEEENGRSKVDWRLFITACTFILTVGGSAFYSVIKPLNVEIEGLHKQIDHMTEMHEKRFATEREFTTLKIQASIDVYNARLVEIETQFRADDQSRNVQFATQQRIDAMLWEKSFGSRYPSDAVYYPSIAK